MPAQVLELLIFAAIAFFIINKLISIVGSTNENDFARKKTKFGENSDLKDVTNTSADWIPTLKIVPNTKPAKIINNNLLLDPDNGELIKKLENLENIIEKFSTETFIKNASKAWKMAIESIDKNDTKTIELLVDKRYIEQILSRKEAYKNLDLKISPELKIADVTFFGNSILIKIIIHSKGIDSEEWTFLRNQNQSGPNWYISNIERAA